MSTRGASGGPERWGISFQPLRRISESLPKGSLAIVTDPLIRKLYGDFFPPCPVVEVERGEAAKSLASLERVYGSFLEMGMDREWTVLAVGGGSVSDLAGFAASTWMRGVGFCAAPTTLLAMVDASIGGKNGVDFRGLKNLVGTFNRPRAVFCDTGVLASLPRSDFDSGMAEAIKHAVIDGSPHFGLIEALGGRREALGDDELERLVGESQRVKLDIADEDEREGGKRRLLNLGHTIGHAVEAVTGLPHGHCVAAGLASACRLSESMGLMAAAERGRIEALLAAWRLPSSLERAAELSRSVPGGARVDMPAFRRAVAAALSADKKRRGGTILFALPVAIGSVRIEPVLVEKLEDFVMEAP